MNKRVLLEACKFTVFKDLSACMILGMDWLSNNHIIIDCGRRCLVFPEHEGLELISTWEAVKELQGGATCFMVVAKPEKKSADEAPPSR